MLPEHSGFLLLVQTIDNNPTGWNKAGLDLIEARPIEDSRLPKLATSIRNGALASYRGGDSTEASGETLFPTALRGKPEFLIWTFDSRIVRFSCSRRNEE
jgi:hypothetical protein